MTEEQGVMQVFLQTTPCISVARKVYVVQGKNEHELNGNLNIAA